MLDSNVPRPWAGRTTLVFSLAAVALGLGNLFRMPYLIGEHGGGPFFLAYVASLIVLALPVMLAEVVVGSYGRGSPLGSLRWLADQSGATVLWSWLGPLQAAVALLLALHLALLTVWLAEQAVILQSAQLAAASPQDVAAGFVDLTETDLSRFWGLAGLLVLAGLLAVPGPGLAMGVIGWLLLPSIVVTLIGLAGYSLNYGALTEAEEFLFRRDGNRFDFGSALAALQSAAFTLGAGLAVGQCFGGRAPRRLPLARSVLAAGVLDTLLMLLVATIIVPLLYAVNVEPSQGISLVFVALPYAFANLPLGEAYGALFFAAMAASGLAALVALLEPAVLILRRDLLWPRWLAALIVVSTLWWLTIVIGRDPWRWLARIDLAVGLALPLLFLAIAVLVGWRVPRPISRGELFMAPRWLFMTWWWMLRWTVPVACLVLLFWQWTTR
jgi:NSS family neurotransmitter:Na+ symporter